MAESNPNSRLEAFCDGVFAIALTLLVIDIKIPSTETITSTADVWRALGHILPSIFAFVLSFGIILITWVNHHGYLKLINRSSPAFFYANGFLLLTVVFIPFPTALLGEYLLTDHSSPAVILYVSTMAVQAASWIVISQVSANNHLTKDEHSAATARRNGQYGYVGFVLYATCAVIAGWYPLTIAVITTLIWIVWLILGMMMKHE